MKYFLLFILFCSPVLAEDFPGGSSTTEEEFKKGFGEADGMQAEDQKTVDADRLKIGGSLQAEYQLYTFEKGRNDFISTPMTLEMYLDSQLKDDVRVFGRGRLIHDASIDETVPSPFTGKLQKQNTGSLDELKISFHTKRKIFWTVGRQKIKWGASKFWNPTDFLNSQKRDFFRTEDQRSGITMVKAHIPLGNANAYLIGINDRASEVNQVGTAARVEIPIATTEWSFSTYSRKGVPVKLGSDFSFALGDFDFYVEGAKSDRLKDHAVSGGTQYQVKYSDEDTVAFGLEGFWQETGEENTNRYLTLIATSRFVPFYVAKSYALASIHLPEPGKWNNSDFNFYYIQNAIDRSNYYRLSWIYKGMSDLIWTVALGNRGGEARSEMKYFNQGPDAWVQLRSAF